MAHTKEGEITNESRREAELRAHETEKDLTPEQVAARLEQAGQIAKRDADTTISTTESNAQQLGADESEMGALKESGKKYEKGVEQVRLEKELEMLCDIGRQQLDTALQGEDADELVNRVTLRGVDKRIAEVAKELKELTGEELHFQSFEIFYTSEVAGKKQGAIESSDAHEDEAPFEKTAQDEISMHDVESPRWEKISPDEADAASGGQHLTARMERVTMGEEAKVPQPEAQKDEQPAPKGRFFASLDTESDPNPPEGLAHAEEAKSEEAASAPQSEANGIDEKNYYERGEELVERLDQFIMQMEKKLADMQKTPERYEASPQERVLRDRYTQIEMRLREKRKYGWMHSTLGDPALQRYCSELEQELRELEGKLKEQVTKEGKDFDASQKDFYKERLPWLIEFLRYQYDPNFWRRSMDSEREGKEGLRGNERDEEIVGQNANATHESLENEQASAFKKEQESASKPDAYEPKKEKENFWSKLFRRNKKEKEEKANAYKMSPEEEKLREEYFNIIEIGRAEAQRTLSNNTSGDETEKIFEPINAKKNEIEKKLRAQVLKEGKDLESFWEDFNEDKYRRRFGEHPVDTTVSETSKQKSEQKPAGKENGATQQEKIPEQIMHEAHDAYKNAYIEFGRLKRKENLTAEETKLKEKLEATMKEELEKREKAMQAVMTDEYARTRERLAKSGLEPSQIEHEMNAEKAKLAMKYFGEQRKMQDELCKVTMTSEKVSEAKKSVIRKALNWWTSLPKAERWAISAGIATGIAVTLGTGGAGMGIGAYFVSKFARSALSSTLVGYTNKGLTKAFESHDARVIEKELTKEISSKNIVEHFDQIRDSYSKASQAQLSKTKLKNVTRLVTSLAVGGGTALMTGMVEKGIFSGAADTTNIPSSNRLDFGQQWVEKNIPTPPNPGIDNHVPFKPGYDPEVQGGGNADALSEIVTVKKGEGMWHPVRRQFEEMLHKDPHALESYGLKAEDAQDAAKVKAALNRATQSTLVREGYIDPADGTEARIMAPGAKIILNSDGTINTDAKITWKSLPSEHPYETVSQTTHHTEAVRESAGSISEHVNTDSRAIHHAGEPIQEASVMRGGIESVQSRDITHIATIEELKIGSAVEFGDGSKVEFGADSSNTLHWRYSSDYKFHEGIDEPKFLASNYDDKLVNVVAKRRMFGGMRVTHSMLEKELLSKSSELNRMIQVHEDLEEGKYITEAKVVLGDMQQKIKSLESDFGKDVLDYNKLSKVHGLEEYANQAPAVPKSSDALRSAVDRAVDGNTPKNAENLIESTELGVKKPFLSYADSKLIKTNGIRTLYSVTTPDGRAIFTMGSGGKVENFISHVNVEGSTGEELLKGDYKKILTDDLQHTGKMEYFPLEQGRLQTSVRSANSLAHAYDELVRNGKTEEAALFGQALKTTINKVSQESFGHMRGSDLLDYGKFPQSVKDLLKK